MGRKWDKERVSSAVDMYVSGIGLENVAFVFGVDVRTARRWMVSRGVAIRGRGRPRSLKYGAVDRDMLAGMLAEDISVREIGRRLGMSRSAVSRRLQWFGLMCLIFLVLNTVFVGGRVWA